MTQDGNVRHGQIDVGEGDLGCLINRTARLIRQRVQAQLHDQGLSDLDYIVLETVLSYWNRNHFALTVAALTDVAVLTAEDVQLTADRLTAEGWFVVRPIGSTEGLEPSAKALKLDSTLKDETRWLFETALNNFSFEEIDQFMAMLTRLYDNLRQ